jgi:hypothetical protein
MRTIKATSFVAAALAAISLIGCGGSGDAGTPQLPPPPPATKEYAAALVGASGSTFGLFFEGMVGNQMLIQRDGQYFLIDANLNETFLPGVNWSVAHSDRYIVWTTSSEDGSMIRMRDMQDGTVHDTGLSGYVSAVNNHGDMAGNFRVPGDDEWGTYVSQIRTHNGEVYDLATSEYENVYVSDLNDHLVAVGGAMTYGHGVSQRMLPYVVQPQQPKTKLQHMKSLVDGSAQTRGGDMGYERGFVWSDGARRQLQPTTVGHVAPMKITNSGIIFGMTYNNAEARGFYIPNNGVGQYRLVAPLNNHGATGIAALSESPFVLGGFSGRWEDASAMLWRANGSHESLRDVAKGLGTEPITLISVVAIDGDRIVCEGLTKSGYALVQLTPKKAN